MWGRMDLLAEPRVDLPAGLQHREARAEQGLGGAPG